MPHFPQLLNRQEWINASSPPGGYWRSLSKAVAASHRCLHLAMLLGTSKCCVPMCLAALLWQHLCVLLPLITRYSSEYWLALGRQWDGSQPSSRRLTCGRLTDGQGLDSSLPLWFCCNLMCFPHFRGSLCMGAGSTSASLFLWCGSALPSPVPYIFDWEINIVWRRNLLKLIGLSAVGRYIYNLRLGCALTSSNWMAFIGQEGVFWGEKCYGRSFAFRQLPTLLRIGQWLPVAFWI